MNVTRYTHLPFPVWVFDDFLSPEKAQEVLDECIELKPIYRPAEVVTQDSGKVRDPNIRKNDVVFVDTVFTENRKGSRILRNLEEAFWTDEMHKQWREGYTIFDVIGTSTSNETIVSRYGNCNFYGWHNDCDRGATQHPMRIVTAVYYVNTIPERFTGGKILFKNKKEEFGVEPKHNRLVVFPASAFHSVENVRLKSDKFEDGRFSLNCWFGYRQ